MTQKVNPDKEQSEQICPKYIKWTIRIKEFSRNKKVKLLKSLRKKQYYESATIHDYDSYSEEKPKLKPKRMPPKTNKVATKTFTKRPTIQPQITDKPRIINNPKKKRQVPVFSRIKKGGENFCVRCKTTVNLWKKWISGNEVDKDEVSEMKFEKKPESQSYVGRHSQDSTQTNTTVIINVESADEKKTESIVDKQELVNEIDEEPLVDSKVEMEKENSDQLNAEIFVKELQKDLSESKTPQQRLDTPLSSSKQNSIAVLPAIEES